MNSMSAPYTMAGRWTQTIHGQRQVKKAPPTTKAMNSRWVTSTRSAATRYHIMPTIRTTGRSQDRRRRDVTMTRVELEAFELVLLRAPGNAPSYDDAELERIQAEHLAHLARLRESGQVLTNG